jgi:hypothetical protein
MVYDTNAFLSMDEMTVNAQYILDFFTGLNRGFTKNAICALLGNMQSESSINFGIYEGLNSASSTNGFGLVQWTPNTKYFDWASANGYANDHVNGELQRILWEIDHNQQWINSLDPKGRSFLEFMQSADSANDLAMAFIQAYERPANPDQPNRGTQADYWFSTLTSGGGVIPTPPNTQDSQKQLIQLLLADTLNGWKF